MKKLYTLFLLILLTALTHSQNKDITLEEIFIEKKFTTWDLFSPVSLSDGEHYAVLEENNSISAYKFIDGKYAFEIIPPLSNLEISIDDFTLSSDNNRILIIANSRRIYRHSSESDAYLFDRKTGELKKINQKEKIQSPVFSPDGNYIAYVLKNNLYIEDLNSFEIKQITDDGKINEIINGLPDWVYEEELGMEIAFDWNSESNKIAFLRFDESNVKEYSLIRYGETYPEVFKYKYPKAGEDNSVLRLFVYDVKTGTKKELNLGENKDIYIPGIKWTKNSDILSVLRLNRLQNYFEILHYDVSSATPDVFYTDEDKYYHDDIFNVIYLKDKSVLLLSGRSGFKHIYHVKKDKSIFQITNGEFEVCQLIGVNEEKGKIYYRSNEPSRIDKVIYSVGFDGNNKKVISESSGFTSAQLTKKSKFIILCHSDANSPAKVTLTDENGKLIRVIYDNEELKTKFREYGFVNKEFFKFVTDDKIELDGWIMKPKNFDESKKYPVLFSVYNGPGSQSVLNTYTSVYYLWYQYLCTKGYIVAEIDSRGTCGRGEEYQKSTYMRLGEYELKDQLEAVKYISCFDYVDTGRIGIWGWSYGGYVVCLAMTKGEGKFKTGLAVAPVTDWRYYDNIYTERFMRKPAENPDGYFNFSPLNFADKMKGNLLLVHGSDDDNVHPQNTFEFAQKLVKANIQFDMHLYTNKNHNISGENTRYHLFKKLSDFISKNL